MNSHVVLRGCLVVSAAVVVSTLISCETADPDGREQSDGSGAPVADGPSVWVEDVSAGTLAVEHRAIGVVEVRDAALVGVPAPVDGTVESLSLMRDQRIEAGQDLASLAPSPSLRRELEAARAELDAAELRLTAATAMFDAHLSSVVEHDDAVAASNIARAQVRSLERLGAGGPRTVIAPFDAVVDSVLVSTGMTVNAGETMVMLRPDGTLEAVFGLEPAAAAKVVPGQPVSLAAMGTPSVASNGFVRAVAPRIDRVTQQVPVYVPLPPDAALVEGQAVTAVVSEPAQSGIVIPRSALVERDGALVVFVVDDADIAHERLITIGVENGDRVLVPGEALRTGDRVVVEGAYQLLDGVQVVVRQ